MNEEVKELLRCLRNFFADTCGVRHQLAKRTIDTITRLSVEREPAPVGSKEVAEIIEELRSEAPTATSRKSRGHTLTLLCNQAANALVALSQAPTKDVVDLLRIARDMQGQVADQPTCERAWLQRAIDTITLLSVEPQAPENSEVEELLAEMRIASRSNIRVTTVVRGILRRAVDTITLLSVKPRTKEVSTVIAELGELSSSSAMRAIALITSLSREKTLARSLLIEANAWIQSKVKHEGGIVGCRDGNLCIACRLSVYVKAEQ